jgi:hypothetical protein
MQIENDYDKEGPRAPLERPTWNSTQKVNAASGRPPTANGFVRPVFPVYNKEEPALGEAVTSIDEVLDIRHIPSAAACSANAACTESSSDGAKCR